MSHFNANNERRRALIAETYALVARTKGMSAAEQLEAWGAIYWSVRA